MDGVSAAFVGQVIEPDGQMVHPPSERPAMRLVVGIPSNVDRLLFSTFTNSLTRHLHDNRVHLALFSSSLDLLVIHDRVQRVPLGFHVGRIDCLGCEAHQHGSNESVPHVRVWHVVVRHCECS